MDRMAFILQFAAQSRAGRYFDGHKKVRRRNEAGRKLPGDKVTEGERVCRPVRQLQIHGRQTKQVH